MSDLVLALIISLGLNAGKKKTFSGELLVCGQVSPLSVCYRSNIMGTRYVDGKVGVYDSGSSIQGNIVHASN